MVFTALQADGINLGFAVGGEADAEVVAPEEDGFGLVGETVVVE